MVEGGEIDHKAHSNDGPGVIQQFRDFDAAVGVALTFARKNKNTLVIVTADHETGGLAVLASAQGGALPFAASWTTKNHSGNFVPLLAEGPGAPQFGGVLDNTEIPKLIARFWKIEPFPRKSAAAVPVSAR